MLKAKLVVVGGVAKAAEIPLKLPTVIGRGREATLTLPHPLVSRQHCELYEMDGMLHVRDLQSLNGTYVDSQRIETCSLLKPEQLLTIGDVTFRAIYSSHDASLAELDANVSHVIEMEPGNASPESDSKIDCHQDVPVDNRPTVRGPQKKPAATAAEQPADLRQTTTAARNESSDVLNPTPLAQSTASPQHSVLVALQGISAAADERQAASLSEIRSQLGDGTAAEVSRIAGLEVGADPEPASPSGISRLEVEEASAPKVAAEDSALGSFIRKLPR